MILVPVFGHSYLANKITCDIRGNEKKRLPVDAAFVDIRGNQMTHERQNHVDILLSIDL